MPVRIYQVTAINQTLTVAAADHPTFVPAQSQALRNAARGSPALPPFQDLPNITFKLECLDGHVLQPMYPGRLVETWKRLGCPDDKSSLIKGSYAKASAKLLNISAKLCHGEQTATFLKPSNLQFGKKTLLLSGLTNSSIFSILLRPRNESVEM